MALAISGHSTAPSTAPMNKTLALTVVNLQVAKKINIDNYWKPDEYSLLTHCFYPIECWWLIYICIYLIDYVLYKNLKIYFCHYRDIIVI